MQLESSEPEETSQKTVDPTKGQNTGPLEVQDTSDRNDVDVQDSICRQIEDNANTPKDEGDDYTSDSQDIDNAVQDDQTSRASQDDNYHTAIDDDNLDDTVQFSNPVTEPFLSRSIRFPTTVRLLKFFSDVSRLFASISLTVTS